MKKGNKKGFSLIELMVVIAIIGILATGAIGVYTSQMAKARDTTRINDFNTLKSAIEQYYQDGEYVYPTPDKFKKHATNKSVEAFLQKLPEDSKAGTACAPNATNKSICDIAYTVSDTVPEGISLGAYELSIAFENADNVKNRAANGKDGGDDEARFEFFTGKNNISTKVAQQTPKAINYTAPTAKDTMSVIRKEGAAPAR